MSSREIRVYLFALASSFLLMSCTTERSAPAVPGASASSSAVPYTYLADATSPARKVYYSIQGEWAIVEGDILLGTVADMEARRQEVESGNVPRSAVALALGTLYRWRNATIPIHFDGSLSAAQQSMIWSATQEWVAKTPIRFKLWEGEEDYVSIQAAQGVCQSQVGRLGGKQIMRLDPRGCDTGAIVHEIGHAVGLFHEHTRADRDKHVIVNLANVIPGFERNFSSTFIIAEDISTYDFASIMHYGSCDFSKGGPACKPGEYTIARRQGDPLIVPNQARLSDGDIAAVTRLYGDSFVDAPDALFAEVLPTGRIQVSFFDNSDDETGFEIDRATSSTGPWQTFTAAAQPDIEWYSTIDPVAPTVGKVYFYRARAVRNGVKSQTSPQTYVSVLPAVTMDDVTVSEGSSGNVNASFVVRLAAPSAALATVRYSTADGTATAGSDYIAIDGTVSFTPGQTSKTITVTVKGDTAVETDETFLVNLSSPTGAMLSDAQAVGTIKNDDSLGPAGPSIAIGDISVTEGNSGTASAVFPVTLSAASTSTVTVGFATADGTATAGSDYVAIATGTVTFTPGQTSKTVTVTVKGDTSVEPNETFYVNLSNPVGGTLSKAQGTGTITNNDNAPGTPSISISDVIIPESNAGTLTALFTVTLSAATTGPVSVGYATADGTATAGSDYVAVAPGTLTFTAGQTSKTIAVTVKGDTSNEPDETFYMNLSNAVGGTLAKAQGTGTIGNDDTAAPLKPSITIGNVSQPEGDTGTATAVFAVTLSAATSATVSVGYATLNGIATAGSDYVATSGTLTFAPGETAKSIAVTVNGDTLVEGNETFFVNLSAPVNATFATAQGVGTLTNDDSVAPTPAITIGDVSVAEGNSGAKTVGFLVTLSAASSSAVSVSYATADGVATAGVDYVAVSGTVTFSPGETSKTIDVSVIGDTVVETNEAFFVNLVNPVSASLAKGQGVATITNDDNTPPPQPSITIGNVSVTEGSSGTVSAVFPVTLSAASATTVTVKYMTAAGTASEGSDYTAIALTTLTFAPGEREKTVTVTVNGDTAVEPDETFSVNLSSAVGATLADANGVGTIANDDAPPPPQPSITIGNVSVTEGNSGTVSAVFPVTLSATSATTVTVKYMTAAGTASGGSDYTAIALTTLTFAPGEREKSITVPVTGDTLIEPNETFYVNLSSPVGATLAVASGTGTVANDDSLPASLPTISIDDSFVFEGSSETVTLSFLVTLSAPSSVPVSFTYGTLNGSATAGSDYVAIPPTTKTIAPGLTAAVIDVTVMGDTVGESDDTFFMNLSGLVGATLGRAQAVGTIVNDDWDPQALPSLDFGGMYGYINGVESPNPATSDMKCPAGYTAQKVLGTNGVDWPLFVCYRTHLEGVEPLYDFGGMVGHVNGVQTTNPFTGDGTCPAGYTKRQVYGKSSVDWSFAYCYRPHVSGTEEEYAFGGMWGKINGSGSTATLSPNPMSQAAGCASGFTARQVLGKGGVDWPAFFCYRFNE